MRLFFSFTLLLLSACAARHVTPVAISQPGDDTRTCEEIRLEVGRNQNAALQFTGAERGVETGNVVMGAAGLLFFPALFAMDISNTERTQVRALADRNENLHRMWRKRECGVVKSPPAAGSENPPSG